MNFEVNVLQERASLDLYIISLDHSYHKTLSHCSHPPSRVYDQIIVNIVGSQDLAQNP